MFVKVPVKKKRKSQIAYFGPPSQKKVSFRRYIVQYRYLAFDIDSLKKTAVERESRLRPARQRLPSPCRIRFASNAVADADESRSVGMWDDDESSVE